MAKRALTTRQKGLLIGAAVAVLVVAGYVTAIKPARAKYEHSRRSLFLARQRLEQARAWGDEIRAERRSAQALTGVLQERGAFDLFSYTNQTLQALELKDHAELENSRTYDATQSLGEVEVRLRGVSLEQVVNFLHKIYSEDKLIAVTSVREFQPSPDGVGLVCSLTLTSPRST